MHSEGNNVSNHRLHHKALQRNPVVGQLLVAIVELEIVMEDQAALHIRWHGDANGGGSSVIGEHHGSITFVRKVKSVPEKKRTDEGQILEFPQGDGTLQQLPFLLQRIELVDEFSRIRKKVVIVVFVTAEKIKIIR